MSSISFPLLEQGFYINLNWLGQLVRIIIDGVGIVGVGVIVFALILKAITTPFDIYQRVKMRKQNLIMEQMKPELEKLQKQYANDKQTYSMKMLELQKKNGYSMLGACLPMIISFVILIIAITAFQSYAQYANLSMYERMAEGYNDAVLEYAVDGKDYHFLKEGEEENELVITMDKFTETDAEGRPSFTEDGIVYSLIEGTDGIRRMQVESTDKDVYLSYRYSLSTSDTGRSYSLNKDKLKQNAEIWAKVQEKVEAGATEDTACLEYFREIGSAASANVFRNDHNPGFLWVKNVWYPDVSYNHPIQEYSAFTKTFNSGIRSEGREDERSIGQVISEADYNILTADLSEEKEQPNGYFVMIIISIGLMLLSQFIMMKSSKATNQYQTVDGQGARTQKIMMVMMPIMFAVFGFLWSAAFTIYNVISSFISIIVTLITNLIIGKIFNKKEEEALKERYTRTAPWKKDGEQKGKGKKKK